MSGLLVTGATGFLGTLLLDHLTPARPGARLYLLTRDPDRVPERFRGPQFSILAGDIRRPQLGLTNWQAAALRRSVTEIIHCAADTSLESTLEQSRAVNRTGTENVLLLAAGCERLIKFLHVSATCVAGRLTGPIPEAAFTHSSRFLSAFQQTRYEAERLVAGYAGSVPAVIARLSPIIGDAEGRVHRLNAVHHLLRLFPRSHLQQAPYESEALMDLINSEWAAGALAWLFLNCFQAGDVWHLTDGPTAAFTAAELLAETHRLFAHHPQAQRWLPIELPRLVPLTDFDEYADATIATGSRLAAQLVRSVSHSLPKLGIAQTFENHRTRALLAGPGSVWAQPAPVREVYAGVVRWCLDTDWGRRTA